MSERIHVVELDATKDDTIKKAIEHVHAKEGQVDVLVNNAGVGYFGKPIFYVACLLSLCVILFALGPMESFSDDDLAAQYDVNLFGVVRVIRAVLPIFRAQKSGRIVNVSSVVGVISYPFTGKPKKVPSNPNLLLFFF